MINIPDKKKSDENCFRIFETWKERTKRNTKKIFNNQILFNIKKEFNIQAWSNILTIPANIFLYIVLEYICYLLYIVVFSSKAENKTQWDMKSLNIANPNNSD